MKQIKIPHIGYGIQADLFAIPLCPPLPRGELKGDEAKTSSPRRIRLRRKSPDFIEMRLSENTMPYM